LAAALVSSYSTSADDGAAVAKLEVVGTTFRGKWTDGRVVTGADLVGAVFEVGDGANEATVRIDAVRPDPKDPTGEIMLHAFSLLDVASGTWRSLCSPDWDGVAMGFPLAGTWTSSGEYQPSVERFSLTCTSGVSGKCVREDDWRRHLALAVLPSLHADDASGLLWRWHLAHAGWDSGEYRRSAGHPIVRSRATPDLRGSLGCERRNMRPARPYP
jgi:hypothetical protein